MIGELVSYSIVRGQDVSDFYWYLKTQLYYKKGFDRIGKRSRILRPLRINGSSNIWIGDDVIINSYTWLYARHPNNKSTGQLMIDDGCTIGNMNHITAVNRVYIGKKVLTADKVHISDNLHDFQDTTTPIMDQPVLSKGEVFIGEGTWIGENVSVLSSRIGKHCVIGSNAVVLSDIPDFCVAVGVPAKIIKRYDAQSDKWVTTDVVGNFSG